MGFSRHKRRRFLIYELLPGGDVGTRLQKGALVIQETNVLGLTTSFSPFRSPLALEAALRHCPWCCLRIVPPAQSKTKSLSSWHQVSSTRKCLNKDFACCLCRSANILLDRNGTAKWGDFGIACLSPSLSHKVLHTAGTVGYADPKYISTWVSFAIYRQTRLEWCIVAWMGLCCKGKRFNGFLCRCSHARVYAGFTCLCVFRCYRCQ